jgi:hypothetical protein
VPYKAALATDLLGGQITWSMDGVTRSHVRSGCALA